MSGRLKSPGGAIWGTLNISIFRNNLSVFEPAWSMEITWPASKEKLMTVENIIKRHKGNIFQMGMYVLFILIVYRIWFYNANLLRKGK